MNMKMMAACPSHESLKAVCLYCDLIEENYWKNKYFEAIHQLTEVVEELYQLEEKFGLNEPGKT